MSNIFRQPILLALMALVLVITSFLIGMGLGFGLGRWTYNGGLVSTFPGLGSGAAERNLGDAHNAQEALGPEFEIFWEAMNLLYRDFYGEIPDSNQMTYGAIRGILNELDDRNTSFMAPEDAEFFRSSIEGSFEGIGARVEWSEEFDAVRITEPFENQPAWLSGLRRGDYILAVDGEELAGSNLTDAIMKIRGEKGTVVVLTIAREGKSDLFDVKVVRDRIEIPTVATDTLGEQQNIAYIRLNSFNENASSQVQRAIEDAQANNPTGLIFDLRGNSGGLLREAVNVTSLFLENHDVLIERFADGKIKTYETEGTAIANDIPLVVLVNGGSASASEIVAGAIQDAQRAPLLGEVTFGKGSVQLPHQLSNNGILRVTIARWFTPNDRSIDGVGLDPDIVVEYTQEQREAGEDPQLDAAVNYLLDGS
ncbi:S41 family peptidase [Chloroflexi bacterium TSY]|nr:S41 family peptidase [Chloroflexi bacterium TSY]